MVEGDARDGHVLRDVMKENLASRNFRLFSPDENNPTAGRTCSR